MKYKFFTIPAINPEAAEGELNRFCSRHRVAFVEKQLIVDGADSFWSVCVTYQEGESNAFTDQRKPRIDYKKVLNEEEFGWYLSLRELRKEVAGRDAIPAYAVFTNEQLATMIQQRISSKTALQKVAGIGKKRVEKYGDAFLQKLNECWED